LQAGPGVEFRALLKVALRRFGLRCIKVTPLASGDPLLLDPSGQGDVADASSHASKVVPMFDDAKPAGEDVGDEGD
jgi:hypothetical protein